MSKNEVRGDEPGLMDAAQTDGPIGRCSVCRLEVKWSEAARPLTTEPVHDDCVVVGYRDHRTRTPPHGDALRRAAQRVAASAREVLDVRVPRSHNQQGAALMKEALRISRRTPVGPEPVYRALVNGFAGEHIEAAIEAACGAGVQPSVKLADWLARTESPVRTPAVFPSLTAAEAIEGMAAIANAMGDDDRPAKIEPVLGAAMCLECYRVAAPTAKGWVCSGCGGKSQQYATIDAALEAVDIATGRPASLIFSGEPGPAARPRRLPAHIDRAARKAYAAGHRDGTICTGAHGPSGCTDQRGVDAFRASLERDADQATAGDFPTEQDLADLGRPPFKEGQ